jgi:hypothetical protein
MSTIWLMNRMATTYFLFATMTFPARVATLRRISVHIEKSHFDAMLT